MRNQKTEGIEIALRKLFPSIELVSQTMPIKTFLDRYRYRGNINRDAGYINNTDQFVLWHKTAKDKVNILLLKRNFNFTSSEIVLLKTISSIVETFDDEIANDFQKSSRRLTSKLAFETLLIASFLRNQPDKRYSNIANMLFSLKDLTFERYEGVKCTSGFIYSNEMNQYIKAIPSDDFDFIRFENIIELSPEFFSSPASYRYVDGKNSFYLIDSFGNIHGIIRIKNPNQFSIVDRLNHKHVIKLLNKKISTRKWIAYIGINDDINVLGPHNTYLKWSKNHWSMRERSLIEKIFTEFGINANQIEILTDTVFSLSELRQGTVILIPDDNLVRPKISGMIDQSSVGNEVRKTIINENISTLNESHSLLGILSSDGLTTISKNGYIVGCGEIISIDHSASESHSGGGRSQAAFMASTFGLAIKVSEDGPISIFKNGKRLITL